MVPNQKSKSHKKYNLVQWMENLSSNHKNEIPNNIPIQEDSQLYFMFVFLIF